MDRSQCRMIKFAMEYNVPHIWEAIFDELDFGALIKLSDAYNNKSGQVVREIVEEYINRKFIQLDHRSLLDLIKPFKDNLLKRLDLHKWMDLYFYAERRGDPRILDIMNQNVTLLLRRLKKKDLVRCGKAFRGCQLKLAVDQYVTDRLVAESSIYTVWESKLEIGIEFAMQFWDVFHVHCNHLRLIIENEDHQPSVQELNQRRNQFFFNFNHYVWTCPRLNLNRVITIIDENQSVNWFDIPMELISMKQKGVNLINLNCYMNDVSQWQQHLENGHLRGLTIAYNPRKVDGELLQFFIDNEDNFVQDVKFVELLLISRK